MPSNLALLFILLIAAIVYSITYRFNLLMIEMADIYQDASLKEHAFF